MTASTPLTINFLLASRGRPHMALLIDREHHGIGRRIDVEADYIA